VEQLLNRIFSIASDADFEQCALEVYRYQRAHVPVYRQFTDLLGKPEPTNSSEIPFLPIAFFKTHEVWTEREPRPQLVFKSSGTTGMQRSQHFVTNPAVYERSFFETYCRFIGHPNEQIILALLPNYIEQGESSLVYMVDYLVRETRNPLSGFYLDNFGELLQAVEMARQTGKKVVLFGVSYALLDLAELKPDLSDVLVIETGGMKGRRKELTKEELHAELKAGFGCDYISSEYGMSELLSQAYSDKNGLFDLPDWMRVQLRDINDPFSLVAPGRTGGVNVIDLANLYSCSFIATQDLGKIIDPAPGGNRGQLQLMGRFDQADIRGCNLLVQ
jgi:hypothetical protein